MITEPTVFVLGAGASKPYGYPTGEELKEQILEDFLNDFDRVFPEPGIIRSWEVPKRDARREVPRFLESFAGPVSSIDLFLAGHQDDVWFQRLGRLAIILRILVAEARHWDEVARRRAKRDWCESLFRELRSGLISREDFESGFDKNDVTIITFNYDRFLEHFLFDGLQKVFGGLGPETVKGQLEHIKIVHVFGQIAPLPWQLEQTEVRLKYGGEIGYANILLLSENLKIIYDGYQNPELDEARKKIAEAKSVFFLGFGYAKENLKILRLPKVDNPDIKRIFGTHLNATPKQCVDVAAKLAQDTDIPFKNVKIDSKCDCLQLLREYF